MITNEEREVGALEASHFVLTTSKEIWALLISRTEIFDEKEKWLVAARVINALADHIYKPLFSKDLQMSKVPNKSKDREP